VLAETGYYFCRNGPVSEYHLTEEDRVEISSIGVPVQSRNPVFVQVMHRSHVRGNKPGAVVSELPCLDLKKYTKCIEFCIELHSLVSQEAIQISQKQKKKTLFPAGPFFRVCNQIHGNTPKGDHPSES
jgi:hypothetical protein